MPLRIKEKALRHEALATVLEGEGFLLTIHVHFRLEDTHMCNQSYVLLRAFFGSQTALGSEDVQVEVGNCGLFKVYLYGPISNTITLCDVMRSLCMLYYWRLDDIEVTFKTMHDKTVMVSGKDGIPWNTTTELLCKRIAEHKIISMEISSPSVFGN